MVSLFHSLPLGGKLCREAAVMRGSYITIQDFQANRQQKWSASFIAFPLGGEGVCDSRRMRGGYINEKQNFSEGNSRYAAERILRNSLG